MAAGFDDSLYLKGVSHYSATQLRAASLRASFFPACKCISPSKGLVVDWFMWPFFFPRYGYVGIQLRNCQSSA